MLVFLQTSPEVFWIPIIVKGLQSCCAMHPRIYHWSVILQTFLHDCCKNGCCAFTQEAILSTEPIKTFLLSFSKKCSSACAGCTALYTTINPLHLCRAKNNTILIKLSPSPSSTPCSFSPGTSSWHGTLTVWSRNIIQILWIFILLRFDKTKIVADDATVSLKYCRIQFPHCVHDLQTRIQCHSSSNTVTQCHSNSSTNTI